ncbi:MAG: D-hexose-6-phosphate mutarotase [Hyphomicrobium sp.]
MRAALGEAGDAGEIQRLNARFGRDRQVSFEARLGGTVAVLACHGARAVVAIQGAQALSYVPASAEGNGQSDVLWLSPVARLDTGKAVRGGVPICWPWFGPHPTDAAQGSHGFVRAARWQVLSSAASAGRTQIVLGFETSRARHPGWPYAGKAEVEITLADSLAIALTTTNLDVVPVTVTSALHSYFAIGDISRCTISGLENRPYIDQLDGGRTLRQSDTITFQAELDRIYQETGDTVVVADPVLGRRIVVGKSGSQSTVVWSPWIEKAQRLGDLGVGGYKRMVCVETANAGGDVVTILPGGRHRLVADIRAEAI